MESLKRNPVIYEINTWVWLYEMGRQLKAPVTLASVPDEQWDGLMHLNVDAVWLMGVWERSPMGIGISNNHPGNLSDFRRALTDFTTVDNVGSPYCVKKYAVDPWLGGDEGLAIARAQLARRGIRLILDFVPNHLAHDHSLVQESPECFIRGDQEDLLADPVTFVNISGNVFACGKDPYYPAWQDVLQVNAFHPNLREFAIETVIRIATMCDGVRCDMAMLVMNEVFKSTWGGRCGPTPVLDYWEELIPAVKRTNHEFIFIAEAYWDMEWALQQQGFDYCYDKRLYDRLEHAGAQDIRMHLQADTGYQEKMIRFAENHDEPRHIAVFHKGSYRAAAVITSTLPGAKLFHDGQFEGRKVKLPVFLRRRPEEPVDHDLQAFYRKLLEAIAQPAFHRGTWQLCEFTGWPDNDSCKNLLGWCWSDETDCFLIVTNYSPCASHGMVRLNWNILQGQDWLLEDCLSEITFGRNGDELLKSGLFVGLGPWESHFLRFYPVQGSTSR